MCQHHFYLQFQMLIKKSHQSISLSTRWRLYLIALAYPCAALGHGGLTDIEVVGNYDN